jgi:hypothetical protein
MSNPQDLYETDMGSQSIDVSASERKFQTSIIIKQDANKSGIISFLKKVEQETPLSPTSQSPQTVRVTTGTSNNGATSSEGY